MTNIINLKEYREAKAKAKLNEWSKFWIAYWFILAGIK